MNFKSTNYIVVLLALVCLFSCKSTKENITTTNEDKPNILVLFLDDLDPNFGCYGNTLVHTPNIDKLASEGMLFTQSYAAATICSPSHTTFFTGCYSSTIGAPSHRSSYIEKLPEGYHILTELMKDAGYFTVNFMSDGDIKYNKLNGATAKTDLNFDRGVAENNRESGKEVFDHLQIINPKNIETYFKGGEWDKKQNTQPFFAYANIEVGKKQGFIPGRVWAQERGISVDPATLVIPDYYADTKEVRDRIAASMDAVSHLDSEVGKFLDALEKEGLSENTVVLLASDHGATLSRHKQQLWTTGTKIPMMIRWPNKIKKGTVNTDLASIIDLAPTCLAAAKKKIPKTMEGLNLLSDAPKNRKYLFATKDGMDGFFDCSRMVITKEYQYIHHFFPELAYNSNRYAKKGLTFRSMTKLYKKGELTDLQKAYYEKKPKEELYDLNTDVHQVNNLAIQKEYDQIKTSYREILFKWQKESGDKVLKARELLKVEEVPEGTMVDDLLKLKNVKK